MKLDFPYEYVMVIGDYKVPGPDEGPESVTHWCALARYRNRIYNQLLTDMPWIDT